MVYSLGSPLNQRRSPLEIKLDPDPPVSELPQASASISYVSETAAGMSLAVQDYLSLPREPQTWLVEPLLPKGGTMLLYGDPKVGKSFAALQLAAALASGQDWLSFGIQEQVPVLYVQLDTPRSLWAERLEALIASGLTLTGLPLLLADRETLGTFPFDILDPSHAALLRHEVTSNHIECVIVDTIREAHSGDENDSTAMQKVIAQLTAACQPAALILISHARKPSQEAEYSLLHDNRGSNYIVGRMDAIVRMTHKSIRVSGRAIDEQSLPIEREENGLWALGNDPLQATADRLLETRRPLRELSKELALASNRSESACRAYLRRRAARLAKQQAQP